MQLKRPRNSYAVTNLHPDLLRPDSRNAQLSSHSCPNQGFFLFISKSSFLSRRSLKFSLHATAKSLRLTTAARPTQQEASLHVRDEQRDSDGYRTGQILLLLTVPLVAELEMPTCEGVRSVAPLSIPPVRLRG